MEVLRGFDDISLDIERSVVSIGNFDGVHLGHQATIGSAVKTARLKGLTSVVCTFDPHTRVFLAPDAPPRLLETLDQRIRGIERLGVDVLVVIPFERAVADFPREDFVHRFMRDTLHMAELHVSKAFTFGAGGRGNVEFLRSVAEDEGFELLIVESVVAGGRPVSSTRIRDALAEGRIEEANELLGRPFALAGEVVAGKGRGRDLQACTANLEFDGRFLPARGVYVTRVRLGETNHPAVTNIGVRPTFDAEENVNVETHLLDRKGDLYGEYMELSFLTRLREEIRFDGPAELAAQIREDVARAAAYFSSAD